MGLENFEFKQSKEQELSNILEGFHNEEKNLNNTVSNKDLASEENTMIESLNYKFLQGNPDIKKLVDQHDFKIDKHNKSISFTVGAMIWWTPKYYDIEVTKTWLVINGEIETDFSDWLDDQEYNDKNSRTIFQKIIDRFENTNALGNEYNKQQYLPWIIKKINDANKVFDTYFK